LVPEKVLADGTLNLSSSPETTRPTFTSEFQTQVLSVRVRVRDSESKSS